MGGGAGVPREEGRDGPAAEDGDHVADAVGVLRVVVEHVEEARVAARVEHAAAGVVGQHALVPEHSQILSRRRRPLRSRSRRDRGRRGVHRRRPPELSVVVRDASTSVDRGSSLTPTDRQILGRETLVIIRLIRDKRQTIHASLIHT